MNSRERLKEYISSDAAYQEYLGGKMQPSDFEKFCIQHCKDIEEMLNENTYHKHHIKLLEQQISLLKSQLKQTNEVLDISTRAKNKYENELRKEILAKYKEIIGGRNGN